LISATHRRKFSARAAPSGWSDERARMWVSLIWAMIIQSFSDTDRGSFGQLGPS
jgi:hypothetical protein